MSLDSTTRRSPRILVVDDDPDHLALVGHWLARSGMEVVSCSGGREALTELELRRPDLILTDLVMSGMDGLRLLSEVHRRDPVLPVIILSGQARIPDAIEAAHLGVSSFLTKPVTGDRLVEEVRRVLATTGARQTPGGEFGREIVHRSRAMADLLEKARLVADGDSTVLLSGATGTGKELLARAIHRGSPRHAASFIGLNCSALPEQLLESELFGHEKGAFTGALSRRAGLFQAADRGTLFLDEVGDMPLMVQAKLLRVLQDFQVRPLGSNRSVAVNVRIVSATHHDLERLVKQGEFREDLFYRLSVVPLELPPLRERREDIPPLIEHFLAAMAQRSGRPRKRFAPEATEYLVAAPWPGNIRQLHNLVEQCSVLCTSRVIPLSLARSAMRDRPGEILPLDEARQDFELRYLVSLLRATDGNITVAARLAGRNRTEFYRLLGRHGLDPKGFRSDMDRKEDP